VSQSETPASLARELGISQKRIRDFLRKEYGKLKPFETRWQLDPGKAAAVRRNFS
jgi:DNA-directed RNA polymerase sigma subunit (sigma70/sigma32)